MGDERESASGGQAPRADNAGRGVLEGAFALLRELEGGDAVGLTRLAAGAGLPKTTAHRLLEQLVALGAVQRKSGKYRMGAQMYRLGQAWQPAPVLKAAARNPLRELAAATQSSVSVVVPEAGRTMIVGGIRGEADDIVPLRPGGLLLRGTAAEMFLPAELATTTPPVCYCAAEWAQLVAHAQEHGVGFNYPTAPVPVSAVAAAVHSASGTLVAAVVVTVPNGRRLDSMASATRRAAQLVGANLKRSHAMDQIRTHP